jgi:NADH-quinone oxidoreductase subunit K
MIPISWYLIVAAGLFCIGLFGVLSRKNAVSILMSVELMLNAVNINLITFWHYHSQIQGSGQLAPLVFVAMGFIVAAAEVAVGLALVISAYRRRETTVVDEMTLLKG